MADKVVLVTGCSEGGIGYHLAQTFAANSCKVYATARNVEKMSGLKVSNIELLALDVKSDASVKEVIDTIIEKEGRIDIVVNNAGIAAHGPTLEASMELVSDAFDTNVFSVIRICRTVLPHMAARKRGLFINIGSIAGCYSTPWAGIYAASKAAVHSLTENMAMECRPFNIDVMLVAPGGIKSNFSANFLTKFSLAPDSVYGNYLDSILKRIHASQNSGALSTDVFAQQVVGKALASRPPAYMTLGNNSTLFKVFGWLPRSWVFNFLWRVVGKPNA